MTWVSLCIGLNILSSSRLPAQSANEVIEKASELYRNHPDSCLQLLEPLRFEKIDSTRAAVNNLIGNAWYFKYEYDSAIQYFLTSAEVFESLGNDKSLVKNFNNLGVCYFFLGQYEKSYEYHNKTRKIREALNDPQLSSTFNNLGLVLKEIGTLQDALKYFRKSLEVKLANQQFAGLSTTLSNIGNCFADMQQYDSAIYYMLSNLAHLDSIPDKRNLADCYNNLGVQYLQAKDYDKSKNYTDLSLQMEKELQYNNGILNSCQNLSLIHFKQKDYRLAGQYIDSAFLLLSNPDEFRSVLDMYRTKSLIDSTMGNFEEAYESLRNYIRVKDKFDEKDKTKLALDLEKKYQTELGEKRIKELEQTNLIKELEVSQARQGQITLSIILGLLFLVILVIYRQFRFKQKAAKLLDEKNVELQKLNMFKDQMFAVISHDLRNPVHAFSNMMDSLNTNLQHATKEELKEFIESLSESASDLKRLLANLLEWALVQIGRMPFNPVSVSVSDLVSESMKELSAMAREGKNSFQVEVSESLKIKADVTMIRTVLRNLISNAIKFSQEGGVIMIAATQEEGHIAITITDNGIGIREEDITKLFNEEADVRSIGFSPKKGAGLGLFICKELIEKNKGKIRVESTFGHGSTFTIVLPAA